MNTFDSAWLQAHSLQHNSQSNAPPIFICGMFRSGSTLLEQILSQHSDITAGGEVDYFVQELSNNYPKTFKTATAEKLKKLADNYLAYCVKRFPEANLLTDKRPDNYIYLGLIKALFPSAKFVVTRRNRNDNCLSIYFTRLDARMNYANNMKHIEHNMQQHEKLMDHWQQLFGEDIYTFDYDALVQAPKETLEPLLSFLGLSYQPELLSFNQANNAVKTASVWQVRQPLYKQSSGRHRNYQKFIE